MTDRWPRSLSPARRSRKERVSDAAPCTRAGPELGLSCAVLGPLRCCLRLCTICLRYSMRISQWIELSGPVRTGVSRAAFTSSQRWTVRRRPEPRTRAHFPPRSAYRAEAHLYLCGPFGALPLAVPQKSAKCHLYVPSSREATEESRKPAVFVALRTQRVSLESRGPRHCALC